MHPASRSLIGRWFYAAKIASWPKLLVPMLFGQALGVAAAGELDWTAFAVGLAMVVLDLLYVVFLNDWGDQHVDRIKRQMFPDDSSPKTIPDGVLPARALLLAGLASGAGLVALSFCAQVSLDRPGLGWAGVGMLAVFAAYTLPPIKLNYRGGGEWLEGLGVGLALPWLGLYLQSGELWTRELWLLPGFVMLAMCSALASGLADEQSDRRGGKRTYTSEYGNRATRALIERVALFAAVVWAISMRIAHVIPTPIAAVAIVIVIVNWRRMRKVSPQATCNAFDGQRLYKYFLHQAQWRSALLIAATVIALTLLGWDLGWL